MLYRMAYDIFVCHTLYMQVEQFHTVVKGLARGPRNTLTSIRNHYLLLVSSNLTRIAAPLEWVVKARDSTAAGYVNRAPSADKKDLFVSPKGVGKNSILDAKDLLQVQEVWGRTVKKYGDFKLRYGTAASGQTRQYHQRLEGPIATDRSPHRGRKSVAADGRQHRGPSLPDFLCV
jgi:hypothetical protein